MTQYDFWWSQCLNLNSEIYWRYIFEHILLQQIKRKTFLICFVHYKLHFTSNFSTKNIPVSIQRSFQCHFTEDILKDSMHFNVIILELLHLTVTNYSIPCLDRSSLEQHPSYQNTLKWVSKCLFFTSTLQSLSGYWKIWIICVYAYLRN